MVVLSKPMTESVLGMVIPIGVQLRGRRAKSRRWRRRRLGVRQPS
jgi:hypothetical protein